MRISENKINNLYVRYLDRAKATFARVKYDSCCRYLKAAAHTAYNFYLGFRDAEIELLLKKLSGEIKSRVSCDYDEQRCVFFDSFSGDNGGLVQQYLSAIMASGYRLTYITEINGFTSHKSAILNMLESYENCRVFEIPESLEGMRKAQFIYDTIIKSKSGKLFIHTNPRAVEACVAFYALPPKITQYKIDLTDHTFWIGTDFIDYSFEFRPFGCVTSQQQRGLGGHQTFYLPFYPIMNHVGFQGYPKEADDKTIIFSGGAFYKIYDEDDTFFKLVKSVLDACPNAIFLFAGSGDRNSLYAKIEEYGLQNKFLLIGQRSDITEVFEHCDIYLNTFPFGGGLMSQYAAQLGKPILNYCNGKTSKVEEVVCQKGHLDLSDNSFEAIVAKAKRLCVDSLFREEYGAKIKSCVVSPDEFDSIFAKCMETGQNQIPYSHDVAFEEHRVSIADKIKYERNVKAFPRSIVKIFGKSSLWICPDFLFTSVIVALKDNRLLKVLKNNRLIK